jgi:hypothetical protein
MLAWHYSKGVILRLSGLAIASLAALLACCGGGGGSSTPPPTTVTVSGTVKFEMVPPKSGNIGLNYAAPIPQAPARAVRVEAVQVAGGTVAASATTDASGAYSFSVPANTNLFIRVKAEMQMNGGPSWHYRVLDNTVTPTPALYAIVGANFDSGVAASTHDLLAPSGWGGSGYTATRAAAPFAILDAVYQATQLVLTASANAAFPDLDLFWSKNNRAVQTDPAQGQTIAVGDIGTTYFDPASAFPSPSALQRAIFILGDENVDTDEYDASVIAHEWGHYFQDVFSRDDSVGGPHAQNQELDMRVAFSEGWGNAFSGMATQSSVYRDSSGPQQGSGGCLNLDGTPLGQCSSPVNLGWYNEGSVQSLLFNFFDTANSGVDQISLGFVPIFNVMANDMRTTRALTSIFPFIKALKSRNPAEAAHIDQLLTTQNIDTSNIDEWASTETHGGSVANTIPIYPQIAVGQTVPNVCSVGIENKLGVYRFFRLTLANAQSVTISVTGASTSDPDIVLRDGAAPATVANGSVAGAETLQKSLVAGDYVIEVYDYNHVAGNPANSCLTVSVSP